MVLIDTAAVAWPPETLAQMGGMRDRFGDGGPDVVAPILHGMLLGKSEIHQDWLRTWREQPEQRLADAVAVLMGADDISARLRQITQPALIVHGEADQAIPLPLGQMLRDRADPPRRQSPDQSSWPTLSRDRRHGKREELSRMTDWIFQGNRKHYDLAAAVEASRYQQWRTPRYRDQTAAGDRVWLQIAGRDHPGIYYVATITIPTYEDPEWHDAGSSYGRWRTEIRFDYDIDPPLLRTELTADARFGSFRPFRGFQGSTVPIPPDIAIALSERAAPRLEPLAQEDRPQRG